MFDAKAGSLYTKTWLENKEKCSQCFVTRLTTIFEYFLAVLPWSVVNKASIIKNYTNMHVKSSRPFSFSRFERIKDASWIDSKCPYFSGKLVHCDTTRQHAWWWSQDPSTKYRNNTSFTFPLWLDRSTGKWNSLTFVFWWYWYRPK